MPDRNYWSEAQIAKFARSYSQANKTEKVKTPSDNDSASTDYSRIPDLRDDYSDSTSTTSKGSMPDLSKREKHVSFDLDDEVIEAKVR